MFATCRYKLAAPELLGRSSFLRSGKLISQLTNESADLDLRFFDGSGFNGRRHVSTPTVGA